MPKIFLPLKTDLIISSMWLTKELQKFCNNSIRLKNNKTKKHSIFSPYIPSYSPNIVILLTHVFSSKKAVFFVYTVSFSSSSICLSTGHDHLTSNVVLELFNCIMQAIKMKQSERTGCKSKRSWKSHMQLILLLFEMTIRDNGCVSRQLDQHVKKRKCSKGKNVNIKQLLKRKHNNPFCWFFGIIPAHI